MLQRLLTHLPSRRGQLLGILLLTLLEAVFASVSITMLIPLTQAIVGSSTEAVWFLQYIPSALLARPDRLFLLFGAILVAKVLISMARQGWSGYLAEKLRTEWLVTLAETLIMQPYAAFIRDKRGDMISDLTQQTNTGAVFVIRYLTYLSSAVVLAFMIGAMAMVQWQVTLVAPLLAVAAWFGAGRYFYRWAQRLGRQAVAYNQMLTSEVMETLTGIKEIKISTSEAFKIGNIKNIARLTLLNRLWTRLAGAAPILGAELLFGLVVIIFFAVIDSDREQLNQILPLLVFYSVGLLRALTMAAGLIGQRFAAVNQLPAFINVTTRLMPNSVAAESATGGLQIMRLETPIRFERVAFAYNNASGDEPQQVLGDVDFELPLNRVACLFGPSGSGKTTIIDLIMRLFEPDKGRITANGHDIRDFDLRAWRRVIGYVGQEPYLFHGTVEDNIRLGEASFTTGDLRKAAAEAAVLDFIDQLPQGFDTPVGDQGAALSGGQKRRIALARALIRRPSLLVLDETTNSLDQDMERELIGSLSAKRDLTILLISHRVVSAQWADLSFTLEHGRLRPLSAQELLGVGPATSATS